MATPATVAGNVGLRHRPIVVLAGWLGCQPKHLRRYEELYRNQLGCSSIILSRIAPAYTIIQAIVDEYRPIVHIPCSSSSSDDNNPRIDWPLYYHLPPPNQRTVQDVAWDLLRDVHLTLQQQKYNGPDDDAGDHHFSGIVFHNFSNGGCFVWERVSEILKLVDDNTPNLPPIPPRESVPPCNYSINNDSHHYSMTQTAASAIREIKQQLIGVIFDSAPNIHLDSLEMALEHVNENEMADLERYVGKTKYQQQSLQQNDKIQLRMQIYEDHLRNDTLSIPQLYLNSLDDPLAPAIYIRDLVQHRRKIMEHDNLIVHCEWQESAHCQHILRHPQEYTEAVLSFLPLCYETSTKRRRQRSKL
jgi:hypothetical protein